MGAAEMTKRSIPFSPPDIGEEEIREVTEALRSGWITTGPRTKKLEGLLREFTGAAGFACLSSNTACMECILRLLGIGPGDEVITSAYTYTASCSPIVHVGATPVLCDVAPGSFNINPQAIAKLITARTKAVIPVDLGGRMADYDAIFDVIEAAKGLFKPANAIQAQLGRVAVVADGAHALGAGYKGRPAGSVADFTAFSFHAVKNFTTAEGGGLAWRENGLDNEAIYKQLMLDSLHGQSKDALAKTKVGAWEYDIVFPGYKCNMTDIQAALGLVQLRRYPELLARRKQIIERYRSNLQQAPLSFLEHFDSICTSSGHLMLARIEGANEQERNRVIEQMAQAGIATNVHYKPLPLFTAYRQLGFKMQDYPNAFAQYENEITLPLHTLLSDSDVDYICENLINILGKRDQACTSTS